MARRGRHLRRARCAGRRHLDGRFEPWPLRAGHHFREPGLNRADAPSRGALVERYLRGDEPPAEYMARVHDEGQAYNGFNLIVGDMEQAWYVSNRDGAPRRLVAGLYALSNHLLDTPWPKLARTKRAFADVLRQGPSPTCPRCTRPWPIVNRPPTTNCPPPACRRTARNC